MKYVIEFFGFFFLIGLIQFGLTSLFGVWPTDRAILLLASFAAGAAGSHTVTYYFKNRKKS